MLKALRQVGDLLQKLPRWMGAGLALVWILVIWQLSSLPSSDEPSDFFNSWFYNCGHAPLFGLLALFAIIALPRGGDWPELNRFAWLAVLGFVVGYAGIDEFHQASSPGRSASVLDVLTDAVGAACTLWIVSYVGREDAHTRGLATRFAAGLALCVLAGLISTVGG